MDKAYVEQYGQLEKNHWWFIIRQQILLQTLKRYLPRQDRLKILNVGAAAGASSIWLSHLGETVSLENDPLFLTCLTDQQLTVINASVTDIPLENNSFDLVCAFDVIEHVKDDHQAIKELLRVCKPGGAIFITVPAFQSLWGTHDIVNGHQRRYKKKQLRHLLPRQHNTILYSSYFNTILFIPVFLFRQLQRLLPSRHFINESDFTYFNKNTFINRVLKFVFGIELSLLKVMRLPFGVSLAMLVRKEPAA